MVIVHKIIIDTCVLIASSINHACSYIPEKITEQFYPTSKQLLEYIKNNKFKEAYVLEISVEKARKKLGEIIDRHIKDISSRHILEKKAMMDEHTLALIKTNDSLNEHLTYLGTLSKDDSDILEIKDKVRRFYLEIPSIIRRNHPTNIIRNRVRASNGFKGFVRRFAREDEQNDFKIVRILLRKFNGKYFDDEDVTILARASYLKKLMRMEEKKFLEEDDKEMPDRDIYLISTDQHFCGVEIEGTLNSLVPDWIERIFGVKCCKPEKILKELLRNN
jgi:hypothetical protein